MLPKNNEMLAWSTKTPEQIHKIVITKHILVALVSED
jgi:hypothetical protein